MLNMNRWIGVILIAVGLILWACQQHQDSHHAEHPATVEHIEGSELKRVTLTEMAIQRIGLKTGQVRVAKVMRSESPRKVVPYSALIYDPHGITWVYTRPQSRTFIRQKVEVDYIQGDVAVLNAHPPVGTIIATVGAAELYGTEFEVGH